MINKEMIEQTTAYKEVSDKYKPIVMQDIEETYPLAEFRVIDGYEIGRCWVGDTNDYIFIKKDGMLYDILNMYELSNINFEDGIMILPGHDYCGRYNIETKIYKTWAIR